jgi:hypothetical protein
MTAEIVGNKNLKGTIKDKKIPAGNPQKKLLLIQTHKPSPKPHPL